VSAITDAIAGPGRRHLRDELRASEQPVHALVEARSMSQMASSPPDHAPLG